MLNYNEQIVICDKAMLSLQLIRITDRQNYFLFRMEKKSEKKLYQPEQAISSASAKNSTSSFVMHKGGFILITLLKSPVL
jgi:hypothetical protein